jgi:hypothetical protein
MTAEKITDADLLTKLNKAVATANDAEENVKVAQKTAKELQAELVSDHDCMVTVPDRGGR